MSAEKGSGVQREWNFSNWTGNPRLEEKGENRMQRSCISQSKGVGWGQRKETEVEGKGKIQKTVENGGSGFSLDVTLAPETKSGIVPD